MEQTSVAGTGARAGEAAASPAAAASPRPTECTEGIESGALEELDVAAVTRRVAARSAQVAWTTAARREHAARRVRELVGWPAGRACPIGRLREAWVAYRYGLETVAQGGSVAAGPSSVGLARRAARAFAMYEAFAACRPPGWPARGPAALCAVAGRGGPATLAGSVGVLLVLAKGMRAVSLEHDAARVARSTVRARRRHAGSTAPIAFRVAAARWETPEARRRRVRDAVLLAGEDPAAWAHAELARRWLPALRDRASEPELIGRDTFAALDGVRARADRYRAELAQGRWQLPTGWPHPTPPATEEVPFT